jgi:integrase|tara:strand:+ start:41155 stop:42081 length:927 start_codon:yes stop_codon:yes gene_type:complete
MSPLRDALERYINMRRGFGYKLKCSALLLSHFVTHMDEQGATIITSKLALDWVTKEAGPLTWQNRLSAVRGFARHLSSTEPRTQIPPTGILEARQRHIPYIYSDQEITTLLNAMLAVHSAKGLHRWTYHSIFGLLAVTGLRVGEAIRLEHHNVDLDGGILTIRDTKFGKSRIVPIHPTTVTVLADYARRRNAHRFKNVSPTFFIGEQGRPLNHSALHLAFRTVSREIGLRRPGDAYSGPRIHDLRHRYAVATLLRWYRDGEDVEQRLPVLSTYLGHSDIMSTYWYLSAYPELMEHAALRLQAHWEKLS